MAKPAIVLFPSPAVGHLIAMVELAKLILSNRPSLSVHILITSQAYAAGPTSDYISTAPPSLTFHDLSATSLPPDFSTSSPHPETLALELLRLNNPNVRRALLSISDHHRVHALIIDFFCTHALIVAKELDIPCYYFFTSAIGTLSLFFYFPTIHENTTGNLKDLNGVIDVPGLTQFTSSDMPSLVSDRNDKAYEFMLDSALNMQKTDGVIVNSFHELEPKSVRAITDGLCVPEGHGTPPIFCVGPLISSHGEVNPKGSEILEWLDSKPTASVVFLCFGSLGVFSKDQLMEIATGLEKSRQRFVWVIRNPPSDPTRNIVSSENLDPDLESLLPEGFLNRTKEWGLVVKSWAPQVVVLSHDSVGGFVTHCGWNSVLEAVQAGVPMLAWPLYAEQRFNRMLMVKEMKIALAVEPSENGFVTAAEVEERVRELMESKAGRSVRERVGAMKDAAEAAMSPGGSSRVSLTKLVDSWKLSNYVPQ